MCICILGLVPFSESFIMQEVTHVAPVCLVPGLVVHQGPALERYPKTLA